MTNRHSPSLGRTVLCVDDDVHLTDLLQYALTREGYTVRVAHDGGSALRLVDMDPPDIAILDANLPDTTGFALCVQLRSGLGIPVIMLTARQGDEDQIAGLGRGADDYIIKPFNMQILIHRLRAVIQRAYPVATLREDARSYQIGSGVFNPEHSQIVSGATVVKLTPTESKILALLLHHEGNPVPAQRIMNHVWGFDTESGDRRREDARAPPAHEDHAGHWQHLRHTDRAECGIYVPAGTDRERWSACESSGRSVMLTHSGAVVAVPALPLPAQETPALTSQTWAALLILDADCRILAANPAAEALIGMAEGHLRGQRFCEAFCPSPCDTSTAHSCTFGPVLRGRERRSHPRWITIQTAARTRTVLLGAAPNLAGGRRRRVPRGAVVTMVPSELLDDADRRRREMIAGALHDLRHGMAVQTLISDMLVASTLSGEAQTLVERLRHSSAYLLTCIDDLLNRSRYDLTDLHLHSQATVSIPGAPASGLAAGAAAHATHAAGTHSGPGRPDDVGGPVGIGACGDEPAAECPQVFARRRPYHHRGTLARPNRHGGVDRARSRPWRAIFGTATCVPSLLSRHNSRTPTGRRAGPGYRAFPRHATWRNRWGAGSTRWRRDLLAAPACVPPER